MVSDHVSILRLSDEYGEQFVCCCAPDGASASICIGDPDGSISPPLTGIVLDTSGPVLITNVRDATALAAWLSSAAVWLRVQELEGKLNGELGDE